VKSETRPSESERAVRVAENVPSPWESGSVAESEREKWGSGRIARCQQSGTKWKGMRLAAI